jgi:hypothetical protein
MSGEVTSRDLRLARACLAIVIFGLAINGITAFPLETEVTWLRSALAPNSVQALAQSTSLLAWITRVQEGLAQTNRAYPFLAYGTDWLAFAHLMLAILFVGAYRDPLRNRWVITFGLIACIGVLFLALIAGPMRGIPWGWRLIDCSFGVVCAVPLFLCRREIDRLLT